MTKRFRVYFFTALFVLLFAFPAFSAQIVDTGTCGGGGKGENVTWTLYEDGKMEISGEGDVVVLKTASRPWYAYLSDIRTVVIGEGVTSTGKFAFESCENLTSVTLPSSLKTIDSSAFAACKSLSMITIPENVQVIGDYAFAACRNLTTITISEGVRLIDEFAFCECDSLLSMTIPVSVAKIGRSAFSGCDNLSTATLLYGVETIDDFAFYNCQKLEKINLPVSVTSIGGSVFAECHSLTSVILPPQITVIDEGAFAHCATLETVVIPSGVTVIAKFAFDECKMLKNVYYTGTITAWKTFVSALTTSICGKPRFTILRRFFFRPLSKRAMKPCILSQPPICRSLRWWLLHYTRMAASSGMRARSTTAKHLNLPRRYRTIRSRSWHGNIRRR